MSSQYPFHLSAICAASVKFSLNADWTHCRRGWSFRVIDLTIWKRCLKFPFEIATSNSTHMPSGCCCLSSLSFLSTSVRDIGPYLCLLLLSIRGDSNVPSRYVTSQLGQLSLASLRLRGRKSSTSFAGVMARTSHLAGGR